MTTYAEAQMHDVVRPMPVEVDHESRQTRLHSTDVAAILGLEGARKSSHTVWLEKTGRLEPWTGNSATEAGKYLEPSILDYAEEQLGPLERNVRCEAKGLSFPLVSTLDARVKSTCVPTEAKTTGIVGPVFGEWGDEGSDIVPQLYLVQTSIQMLCSEADMAYLFALIGGRGFVSYRIQRDDEVIAAIVEQCDRWWDQHITKGIEPALSEPIPLEVLKRIRRQPEKTVDLYEDAELVVSEFENAKAIKSSAEKAHAEAQSKLIALLGDAEAGTLPDGRKVTYLSTTRRGYVVADTTFRTLRIKKG